MSPFPSFTVASADPFERGRQYGSGAAEYVRGSVEAYADTFAHYTGLGWDEVRARSRLFRDPIGEYDESILRELEGIAAGAELPLEDVLAVNARSEIMFGLATMFPSECTSFYVGPSAAADGHVLMGQNWDWLARCAQNTILVEVDQGGAGPSFTMVAEAGLVGKIGFNSAGLGVALNALVSSRDAGEPGVPVHVILRAILGSTTIEEAVAAIVRAHRGASANYLIGSARGVGVDVETGPGGVEHVFLVQPEDDIIGHANHFTCSVPFTDQIHELSPDSPLRIATMRDGLAERSPHATRENVAELLREHASRETVCRHVDEAKPEPERGFTVASWVIDLTDRVASLAAGPPCESEFVTYRPPFAAGVEDALQVA
jgi:isopenicillin-N N-acyltransferase-like protein